MTERAQALEAIRERLKNFETVKHAMDRIGNTPLATTRYVEDVKTLLDLLAVQPPPPVGSPTTEDVDEAASALWRALCEGDGEHSEALDRAIITAHMRRLLQSTPVEPAGASAPLSGLARFDLVSVSFAYTSDHEMERADDGEWVRFDDVFPPASLSTVEPTVHNDLCSWCLTQADHVAASEECYERNSERGRIDSKPPVEPAGASEPPSGTNLLGDHLCWACDRACDCCQPDECVSCSRCGKAKPQRARHKATCATNGHIYGHTGACVFCGMPKDVDFVPAESQNPLLCEHETVEPAGAADDARHQQEVAISASGNCDDFEATIAELRQDLDEANAVIARYGFGGAKRIEAKLNSEVAWRDDEIKRLKALLKSLETSTPVESAGMTGQVRLCGALHMDTGAVCELPLDHAENHRGSFSRGIAQWPYFDAHDQSPAPVSPVEPTPEPPQGGEDRTHLHRWHLCPHCGGKGCNSPERGGNDRCWHCGICDFVECADANNGVHPAPTGAPAPCVWVADGEGYLRPGCTDAHLWGDYVETTEGWQCCPYCEAPLTVER